MSCVHLARIRCGLNRADLGEALNDILGECGLAKEGRKVDVRVMSGAQNNPGKLQAWVRDAMAVFWVKHALPIETIEESQALIYHFFRARYQDGVLADFQSDIADNTGPAAELLLVFNTADLRNRIASAIEYMQAHVVERKEILHAANALFLRETINRGRDDTGMDLAEMAQSLTDILAEMDPALSNVTERMLHDCLAAPDRAGTALANACLMFWMQHDIQFETIEDTIAVAWRELQMRQAGHELPNIEDRIKGYTGAHKDLNTAREALLRGSLESLPVDVCA